MTEDEGREQEHGGAGWMDQLRRFWAHPAVQIGQWVVAILLGAILERFSY